MANTRQSTKRARQSKKRQARNAIVKTSTKGTIRRALEVLKGKDVNTAKEAYTSAIRALSKAASKGVIPKARAARKIGRLTAFAQKLVPDAFAAGATKAKKTSTKSAT